MDLDHRKSVLDGRACPPVVSSLDESWTIILPASPWSPRWTCWTIGPERGRDQGLPLRNPDNHNPDNRNPDNRNPDNRRVDDRDLHNFYLDNSNDSLG